MSGQPGDWRVEDYRFHDRYRVGGNATCVACSMNAGCGKGCPAAIVAAGERIGAVDAEVCPVTHCPAAPPPGPAGRQRMSHQP